MRISGKYVLLVLFSTAIGLCLWVRYAASKLKTVKPAQEISAFSDGPQKPKPGYRTKMYPTMEQARLIAEKKLSEISKEKNIITKYESSGDGWIFYYESEKYLNSGNPTDKSTKNTPIYIRKDGSAEYWTEEVRNKPN